MQVGVGEGCIGEAVAEGVAGGDAVGVEVAVVDVVSYSLLAIASVYK